MHRKSIKSVFLLDFEFEEKKKKRISKFLQQSNRFLKLERYSNHPTKFRFQIRSEWKMLPFYVGNNRSTGIHT